MLQKITHRLVSLQQNTIWRYFESVLLVLLASAISFPIHFVIDAVNLVMLYLVAVVIAATFLGRGPAILASILSVLTFDFFLVEPRLSFSVVDTQYILTFLGLLVVGLVISNTVARLRGQYEITRQREAHTMALNSLSQDLTGAVQLDDMLHSVVLHISQTFTRRVVVFLPKENHLQLAADSSEKNKLDASEFERARMVYEDYSNRAIQHLPGHFLFLPLRTSLGPVGILGIDPGEDHRPLSRPDQSNLLQGFANLAALAIERARLAEQASQAQVLQNTERLQAALLNSISHELRTPLASITGALSTILETPSELHQTQFEARQELLETAYEEAQRLNLLVGNLLDISRLESGTLRLSLEPCDIQDLVGISLERFSISHPERSVITSLEPDLPLLELDLPLMVQVLTNLLENAAKYSPTDSPIELGCYQCEQMVCIEVRDQGIGIPAEDSERIFDKFYRSYQAGNIPGLGLGLSISKGIVEVHHGKILAQSRGNGGLTVLVELPLQQMTN